MSNKKESRQTIKSRRKQKKRNQLELVEVFIEILSQDKFLKTPLFQKANTNHKVGTKIINFMKKWGLIEDA